MSPAPVALDIPVPAAHTRIPLRLPPYFPNSYGGVLGALTTPIAALAALVTAGRFMSELAHVPADGRPAADAAARRASRGGGGGLFTKQQQQQPPTVPPAAAAAPVAVGRAPAVA
jgi:hypothetical protein